LIGLLDLLEALLGQFTEFAAQMGYLVRVIFGGQPAVSVPYLLCRSVTIYTQDGIGIVGRDPLFVRLFSGVTAGVLSL
jgi:hypothetical protein